MVNTNELPERIPNMQLCYVAAHLDDWYYGIMKSQAADIADGFPVAADMVRLKDRIGDLIAQWEFLHSKPLLDCPESQGVLDFEYPKLDELPEPENKDVKLIANMIVLMHNEFARCQSARQITGIIDFDYERGVAFFDNISSLVSEYIEPKTPSDYPKSSPEQERVGAGRTGT